VVAAAHVEAALAALNLTNSPPADVYNQIGEIVSHLQQVHAQAPIAGNVTGNISERLCRYGLQAAVAGPNGGSFQTMPQRWKWVGDFYLEGHPFNVIISVKSFKARERLLASGSGNLLSPTIAWGLFDNAAEFSYNRVVSYAYRAFVAIYAPATLFQSLPEPVLSFTNVNGRPLLRNLSHFVADIRNAIAQNGRINPRLL
jgi:hypothetical protein